MRKILVVLLTTLISLSFSSEMMAQTKTKMTVGDKLLLMDGDQNYQNEYWDAAYKIYKDLHLKYPNDSKLSYKAGKVCLKLERYDEALTFLTQATVNRAKDIKDLEYYLGMAQHKQGMLDDAMKNFETYRATLKGKAKTNDPVNDYIFQIALAKQYMSMPVNVTIRNMGSAINTEFVESNPSVTADGRTLIFSTLRPGNTGGQIDPVIGMYYQDIWISELDSASNEWLDAELLPGLVNSKEHDANTSISADGNIILIYKSLNGGDLYYSKRKKNGEWKEPIQIKGNVNTSYFESSGCITLDKKIIFFVSEASGGKKGARAMGNGDIWTATKISAFEYGDKVNLGPVINSIDDEASVFVHPDGKTIFFSSNGKRSIGGYDIFKSEFRDGKWTTPINLGYPINTLGDEKHFTLTADGTKAYIASQRNDSKGKLDIYEIDMTNYVIPDPEGVNQGSTGITSGSISILKGKVLDGKAGTPIETIVKIKDDKGNVIDELETSESGDFLIVLDGGKNYTLEVKAEGYNAYSEQVFVPKTEGKTETIVKPIFLNEGE